MIFPSAGLRGYSIFKVKSRGASTFSSSTGRSSYTGAPPGAPFAGAPFAGAAAFAGAPFPPAG